MMLTQLPHRGVLEIQGEDKAPFLQSLISNDINDVTPERAIYGILLTPQGRFLYDFFIMEKDGSYFLDVEARRLADFSKKLSLYKLRSRVVLIPRSDMHVYALWGQGVAQALELEEERGNARSGFFMDPRLVELGARMIVETPPAGLQMAPFEDYDVHRLKLGVPEGGTDLIPDKSILLECGLDELNAISWTKGCYIGQELTTRTKFLGLVRKRLLPVKLNGPAPEVGTDILLGDTKVGTMCTHGGGYGLALLRLEHLNIEEEGQGAFLQCGETMLRPYKPFWVKMEG